MRFINGIKWEKFSFKKSENIFELLSKIKCMKMFKYVKYIHKYLVKERSFKNKIRVSKLNCFQIFVIFVPNTRHLTVVALLVAVVPS